MAVTGESYQKTLSRLRAAGRSAVVFARDIDLIPIWYFGTPLTLATFEILGDLACVVMAGGRVPLPFPKSPFFALARRRGLS